MMNDQRDWVDLTFDEIFEQDDRLLDKTEHELWASLEQDGQPTTRTDANR